MTGKEVLQAFLEGSKIRRIDWPEKEYVFIDDKIIKDEEGNDIEITLNDILYGYFKIVKEGKRYWLWDVKERSGNWFRSSSFLSENGHTTYGLSPYENWDTIEKRKTDIFIDVEVE